MFEKIFAEQSQKNNDWDRADIIYALRKKGLTLRHIAREHGYCETSLYAVLDRCWPKAEKIIAKAIGLKPKDIWPSRYAKRDTKPSLIVDPSLRCAPARMSERRAA